MKQQTVAITMMQYETLTSTFVTVLHRTSTETESLPDTSDVGASGSFSGTSGDVMTSSTPSPHWHPDGTPKPPESVASAGPIGTLSAALPTASTYGEVVTITFVETVSEVEILTLSTSRSEPTNRKSQQLGISRAGLHHG